MRKVSFTLIFVLCALLLLAGCTAESTSTDVPVQETEAPEPTPVPEGMQEVFGRDVTLAALGEFPEGMKTAMLAEAEACGIPLNFADTAEEAAAADLAILLDPEEAMLPQFPQKVVISADADLAARTDGIFLTQEGTVELAFDALMNYSGHEAPVRVIGIFTDENSPAFAQYNTMIAEGKLQSRGVIFAGETCKEELSARLDEIVPGLLDSIYAEEETLALLAYDVLKEAQRGDAVEVIVPVLSDAILAAMKEEHFLMGAGVGIDVHSVGIFAVRKAISTLAGESVENLSFTPGTVFSDTVYSLMKDAAEGETIASLLSKQSGELPFGDAVLYLREYTENQK
ncbi:MAG: hypothetical protein IJP37_01235 [Clostridia bacterium]|nr:hypothetical protein [Clostridia bacterium]